MAFKVKRDKSQFGARVPLAMATHTSSTDIDTLDILGMIQETVQRLDSDGLFRVCGDSV